MMNSLDNQSIISSLIDGSQMSKNSNLNLEDYYLLPKKAVPNLNLAESKNNLQENKDKNDQINVYERLFREEIEFFLHFSTCLISYLWELTALGSKVINSLNNSSQFSLIITFIDCFLITLQNRFNNNQFTVIELPNSPISEQFKQKYHHSTYALFSSIIGLLANIITNETCRKVFLSNQKSMSILKNLIQLNQRCEFDDIVKGLIKDFFMNLSQFVDDLSLDSTTKQAIKSLINSKS